MAGEAQQWMVEARGLARTVPLESEDALAQLLNSVAVPLLLLSGLLLLMPLAPRWLYLLSRINAFSHAVDGARAAVPGTETFHRESA